METVKLSLMNLGQLWKNSLNKKLILLFINKIFLIKFLNYNNSNNNICYNNDNIKKF